METSLSTTRPWERDIAYLQKGIHISAITNDSKVVANAQGQTQAEAIANAELIVRAVNHFDELVELANDITHMTLDPEQEPYKAELMRKAESLLTKVKK